MITAFVQFALPSPVGREQAKVLFLASASKYQGIAGLVRKYYLLSESGGSAGGVYLWTSRADAERFYDDDWHRFVQEKYGVAPTLIYFETPVVIDNPSQKIITDMADST